MKLLNQGHYFERRGNKFIYRPTIFSAGFLLSSEQKDRLLGELTRLQRRFFVEGVILIALVAGVFMAGIVRSPAPIAWFMLASIGTVLLLFITAIYRQRRLIDAILGHYTPDVPRKPIQQALAQPRPILARRYAIPIMRSTIGLILLATIAVDAFALFPIIAALRSRQIADGPADNEAITEMLSLTLYNVQYWLVIAAINIVLLLCAVFLVREERRLRALSDFDGPGMDSNPP
ncbi:MAG: hypothetical protein HKN28_03310 [Alphaproteobacteria bacterium]|nr:hypothetical protein [Alphaproteobacteria bacterium]